MQESNVVEIQELKNFNDFNFLLSFQYMREIPSNIVIWNDVVIKTNQGKMFDVVYGEATIPSGYYVAALDPDTLSIIIVTGQVPVHQTYLRRRDHLNQESEILLNLPKLDVYLDTCNTKAYRSSFELWQDALMKMSNFNKYHQFRLSHNYDSIRVIIE